MAVCYQSSMDARISTNLAENVRQLRETRGQSQQQLARLAGLPRPTWASLESGSANPTLSVLLKAAAALQVSLEELIGPPRSTGTFYPADEIRTRKRGDARIRNLLPESIPGMEIERLELPPGATLAGIPHTHGTREYLTCERGRVKLVASGESWDLEPGDVVVFRGDQRHSYRNPGRVLAVAYSVVALAPVGS
jgi:transcriptional regulator with XRE-family HTH domain